MFSEWLKGYFVWLNGVTGNEIATAAITGVLLSTVMVLGRSVPKHLLQTLIRRYTIKLDVLFHDGGAYNEFIDLLLKGSRHKQLTLDYRNLSWFYENDKEGYKYLSDNRYSTGIAYVPGYGNHLVWLGGRPVWIHRNSPQPKGGTGDKTVGVEYTVRTIGRNAEWFKKNLSMVRASTSQQCAYLYKQLPSLGAGFSMVRSGLIGPANPGFFTDFKEAREIKQELETFFNNEKAYIDMGLSYKLHIILHGEPGTGKTSLVKYMAETFNRDFYVLDQIDKNSICHLNQMKKGSIVLFEDVHSNEGLLRKEHQRKTEGGDTHSKHGVTLSAYLNTLDGVEALDGLVLFTTTNYLDRLDPAIVRPGRTDMIREIKHLSKGDIRKALLYYYPNLDEYVGLDEYHDLRGCDLTSIRLFAKFDVEKAASLVKDPSLLKELQNN